MSYHSLKKTMEKYIYRSNLEQVLSIKQVKPDVYTNCERLFIPPGARGVFGGTLVAQSLFAAIKTVTDAFVPTSLHSNFLIGADAKNPVYYHVTRLRDGRSFSTREVKAYQKDRVIFTQTVSFTLKTVGKSPKEQALSHFKPPPNTVPFEKYYPAQDSFRKGAIESGIIKADAEAALHNFMRRFYEGPTEYLFTEQFWGSGNGENDPDKDKEPHEIIVDFYLRVRKQIKEEAFHYVALAYFSDAYLLVAVMKFHHRPLYSSVFSVSLDHTVYFHKPVDVNEFVQYAIENPKSGDSRQLMLGHIYNKNKEMVASVVQEGLVVVNDGLLKSKL